MRRFIVFVVLGMLFVANQTMAQGLGFKGVGGRLFFADPEGAGGTIGLGGHVHLGEIINNLVWHPSLEYFKKSGTSSITINGDIRYYFPTPGNVDFFAGGGLAIQFLNNGGDQTDLGLDILGGADFPIADNLVATAKIKFLISDVDVLKITGGITYLLGK